MFKLKKALRAIKIFLLLPIYIFWGVLGALLWGPKNMLFAVDVLTAKLERDDRINLTKKEIDDLIKQAHQRS